MRWLAVVAFVIACRSKSEPPAAKPGSGSGSAIRDAAVIIDAAMARPIDAAHAEPIDAPAAKETEPAAAEPASKADRDAVYDVVLRLTVDDEQKKHPGQSRDDITANIMNGGGPNLQVPDALTRAQADCATAASDLAALEACF